MPSPDDLQSAIQDGLDLTLDGWRKFNTRDAEATEAAVEIMEAAAMLAEKYPDEYFRMKPGERDIFYRQLRLDFVRAANALEESVPLGDITGGQDPESDKSFLDSFKDAAADLLKGLKDLLPGGDEPEGGTRERDPEQPKGDGFDFLVEEKFFWLGMLQQGSGR